MTALVHGPLAYKSVGDLVTYLCDCGYETQPHFTMEGALQALGEHIADPSQ